MYLSFIRRREAAFSVLGYSNLGITMVYFHLTCKGDEDFCKTINQGCMDFVRVFCCLNWEKPIDKKFKWEVL